MSADFDGDQTHCFLFVIIELASAAGTAWRNLPGPRCWLAHAWEACCRLPTSHLMLDAHTSSLPSMVAEGVVQAATFNHTGQQVGRVLHQPQLARTLPIAGCHPCPNKISATIT